MSKPTYLVLNPMLNVKYNIPLDIVRVPVLNFHNEIVWYKKYEPNRLKYWPEEKNISNIKFYQYGNYITTEFHRPLISIQDIV